MAIERLMQARGFKADAPLARTARKRLREKQKAERLIERVFNKLFLKHSDPFPIMQAALPEILALLVKIATANPTFTEEQIAEELAKDISKIPLEDTLISRWSRIYTRDHEQNPDLLQSLMMTWGLQGTPQGFVTIADGDGLEAWTDEQIEEYLLAHYREKYRAGPTAEAVASAYLDSLQQRAEAEAAKALKASEEQVEEQDEEHVEEQDDEEVVKKNWDERDEEDWDAQQEAGEQAAEYALKNPREFTPEQKRAAEILNIVYQRIRSSDAALIRQIEWTPVFGLIEHMTSKFPDLSDDEISEKVAEAVRHTRQLIEESPQKRVELNFEGLTITSFDSPKQKP